MKTTNNTDTHHKYINFKKHQIIVDDLKKDDIVSMAINGVEQFSCKILYGNSSHTSIMVQDKGSDITDNIINIPRDDRIQAMKEWLNKEVKI